jgi:hypothetical protein
MELASTSLGIIRAGGDRGNGGRDGGYRGEGRGSFGLGAATQAQSSQQGQTTEQD